MLIANLTAEEGFVGKTAKPLTLGRYEHLDSSDDRCVIDFTLTRKTSSEFVCDRTANRHR